MLEQLNEVNWQALHSDGETASGFPDAVRAYATALSTPYTGNMHSTELEDHSYRDPLATIVLPQGHICEVSSHAIPFLLEILLSPEIQNQVEPLYFLGEIAYAATVVLESEGTHVPDTPANDQVVWARLVIEGIRKGLPAYNAFLMESDDEETAYAAQTLLEQLEDADRLNS